MSIFVKIWWKLYSKLQLTILKFHVKSYITWKIEKNSKKDEQIRNKFFDSVLIHYCWPRKVISRIGLHPHKQCLTTSPQSWSSLHEHQLNSPGWLRDTNYHLDQRQRRISFFLVCRIFLLWEISENIFMRVYIVKVSMMIMI